MTTRTDLHPTVAEPWPADVPRAGRRPATGPLPAGAPPGGPPPTGGGRDAAFRPVQVLQAELDGPLPELQGGAGHLGAAYGAARLLVRLHGEPLGTLDVPLGEAPVPAAHVAEAVARRFAGAIADHLAADGLGPATVDAAALQRGLGERRAPGDTPPCHHRLALGDPVAPATVVVATCRRAGQLPRTLDSILASDHPDFEVVVVDNGPDDPATRAAVLGRYGGDPRVRYLQEPVAGLSRARNLGYQFSRGEIVAFTDDDVVVDPQWLRALGAALAAHPRAACATGLVTAAELETPAQVLFEDYGGLAKGFSPQVFSLAPDGRGRRRFPESPGRFGTGGNLAVRKSSLPDLWGFDVHLGAGSRGAGGEDLDAFVDLLYAGHEIVYEPRAVVWHTHHRDSAVLADKLRQYGTGLGAFLAKQLLAGGGRRADLLRAVPDGLRFAVRRGSRHDPRARAGYPADLVRRELSGIARGPLAYVSCRLHDAWETA